MKVFIMSHFSYCPLVWMVWMCHSRTLNNKISKLHEELLNINTSVTIHHRYLQELATDLDEVHHGLASELTNDIFLKKKYDVQV